MAQGQISKYEKEKKPKIVTCSTCAHFRRDTSGPSRNAYTHVYFMGTCAIGLTPHSPIKQFADKPHQCNQYVKDLHTS